MSVSEFELKKWEVAIGDYIKKKRPPVHIRDKVDLSFYIKDQSIVIFEIRPLWVNPNEKVESPIAKATYIKSKNIWKIYWQRAYGKWHSYEPTPEVATIEDFLNEIENDRYGCFWG